MAYGRSKLAVNNEPMTAVPRPSVGPAIAGRTAVARTTVANALRDLNEARIAHDETRELENLRAVNAHLLRELNILREREAEAQHLADRDGLTGLYNRRRMLELLETAIADANEQRLSVGLLFIDLNGFKAINDEYGHAAGDKILTTVATRISARVRTGDAVARYGGDEFVVVLPAVPDPSAVSRVADTIRERISLPYWINGEEQHLTAAIGESLYPHDGDNAAMLLDRADLAMYRMKQRLARPMVTLGCVPQQRLGRRRNDKTKLRSSGAL
jgi:diguanylate cyclase (GGDEF)-like protein